VITLLAQDSALPEALRAMRDQFQQGGSLVGLLFAILLIAALLAVVYVAVELQRRKQEGSLNRKTPLNLFEDLLAGLRLSNEEQAFLKSACQAAGLPHPAAALISEKLFDQTIKGLPDRNMLSPAQLASLRGKLFKHRPRVGFVGTSSEDRLAQQF